MQLRSRKTNQTNKNSNINNVNQHYHNTFRPITKELLSNFKKMTETENKIEKIKIATIVFELINKKIAEIIYLKDQPEYQWMTNLYTSIKKRIPGLIEEVSQIMITEEKIDDTNIKIITNFLELMLKVRNKLQANPTTS